MGVEEALQKCKQSLYFPEEMLADIRAQAKRLDRSLSWVMQRAWKLARKDIAAMDSDAPGDSL
jgi:uncharacterized small protein (TIGR04563 family)